MDAFYIESIKSKYFEYIIEFSYLWWTFGKANPLTLKLFSNDKLEFKCLFLFILSNAKLSI